MINLKLIQPRLFVGRGMREGAFSLFKYACLSQFFVSFSLPLNAFNECCCPCRYTMFWVLLLATKLVVSFYVEVLFGINVFIFLLYMCMSIFMHGRGDVYSNP